MTSNKAEYELLEKNFLGGVLVPAKTRIKTSANRVPSMTWHPLNELAEQCYEKMVLAVEEECRKILQNRKDGLESVSYVSSSTHLNKILNRLKPKKEVFEIEIAGVDIVEDEAVEIDDDTLNYDNRITNGSTRTRKKS